MHTYKPILRGYYLKHLKMKNITIAAAIVGIASVLASTPAYAGVREDSVDKIVANYLPGVTGFGKYAAKSVVINDNKRRITIKLGAGATDIPFTAESLDKFKADCRAALGAKYAKYDVTVLAGDVNLDKLVLFAKKKNIGPTESSRFIVRHDRPAAPQGLDGSNIAVWQSHGWYFEPKLNRWEWQRARMFETVEDLYTQSYVMPFLMPMLENAGAYVMSPRERDVNTTEIIIDNDASDFTGGKFALEKTKNNRTTAGFGYKNATLRNGDHPFADGTAVSFTYSGDNKEDSRAVWSAAIPADGSYAVYVSYADTPANSHAARYRVNAANGNHDFTIDQHMGAGTWIYLGHFPFKASDKESAIVELFNDGPAGTTVSADAVKIGGGMGNVARIVTTADTTATEYEYITSGYPRFTEGARYFLQWAGAPDSVFTPTEYVNDYNDDYRSRGLWVNWLTGGSSMLPAQEGLHIPVDLSFAFHSDAGTTMNDSIIGTLGIYSTAGDILGNGSDRSASRDFTDLVMTNIVDDVRATFEPNWTRRGMWDKSYFEARVPAVPAMLLELLSHQNFADMSYGLDPAFRFVVSRAIYKGMLKFIAHRDGRQFVVQPLPVRSFAITATGKGSYTLSWTERTDKLEPTATPSYYIVEERIDDGAFKPIAQVDKPEYTVTVTDSDIHSYRIVAGNDGGLAFPGEVLALCNRPGTPVTIVNGFTRVSAPDRFDSGDMAGFYPDQDNGVAYGQDISFIGKQFEFRRALPWLDDDNTGFGNSRADYEDKVIAGNTFDYVYTHGRAIADAGHPFVSSSAEAFAAASDTPAMVDIILGKQKEIKRGRGVYGTDCKTFTPAMQQRIRSLAQAGTSFMVSGSYVATDLWDNAASDEATAAADQAFAKDVLGYSWRTSRAAIEGGAYQVPSPFKAFGKGSYTFNQAYNAECYAVESPDGVMPADKERGASIMLYDENHISAASAFDAGTYRTVVMGFPFETISDSGARTHLMTQILNFLNKR